MTYANPNLSSMVTNPRQPPGNYSCHLNSISSFSLTLPICSELPPPNSHRTLFSLTISVVVWWNVGVSPSSLPTSPLPSPPLPSPATTERSALPVMVMRKVAYSAWLLMANPQLSRFLLINYPFFFLIWVLFCFSFSLSKFGVKMWGRGAGLLYCWYGVFRCMMIGVGIHWCCSH